MLQFSADNFIFLGGCKECCTALWLSIRTSPPLLVFCLGVIAESVIIYYSHPWSTCLDVKRYWKSRWLYKYIILKKIDNNFSFPPNLFKNLNIVLLLYIFYLWLLHWINIFYHLYEMFPVNGFIKNYKTCFIYLFTVYTFKLLLYVFKKEKYHFDVQSWRYTHFSV